MERVVMTKAFHGIAGMQVCAAADATDEEILSLCNRENLSGTSRGWCAVLRDGVEEKYLPVTCVDDPARRHFLVTC